MVVVDKLRKYAHFMSLTHPYSAEVVAHVYLDHVFKLHGWPRYIFSDKDPIFINKFCQAQFSIQATEVL